MDNKIDLNKIFTKQNTYVIAQVFCGIGMILSMRICRHSTLDIPVSYTLFGILFGILFVLYVSTSFFCSYKMLSDCNKWDKVLIGVIQTSTVINILMAMLYKMTDNSLYLIINIIFRIFNIMLILGSIITCLIIIKEKGEESTEIFRLHKNALVHLPLLFI